MLFRETRLLVCYVVEPVRMHDHRGLFTRLFCQKESEERGLNGQVLQSNVGFSPREGTLRGLHYQTAPHAEVKIVRCTRGAMCDVVVDLRPQSLTHKQWFGVELTEDNGKMIYVPEGFAQGYLTLVDNT